MSIFGAMPWYVGVGLIVFSLWLLRFRRSYLAGTDCVFVTGDPHGVIVVHGIITTKTPLSLGRFKRVVQDKIACHTRFRQTIVRRWWRWHYFQTNEERFNLMNHIRLHTLKPKMNTLESWQDSLEDFISEQIQTPIHFEHPPWELILIERYGGGSCVVLRVHHAIADGVTLMRLAMSIFTRADQHHADDGQDDGTPLLSSSTVGQVSPAPSTLEKRAPSTTAARVNHPRSFHALARYKKPRPIVSKSLFTKCCSILQSFFYLLFMRSDPSGILKPSTKITPSDPVRARWLRQPFDLIELKQFSYATGCSVNDIIFYLVASSLRQYCLQKGQQPSNLYDSRSIMWVSLQGTSIQEKVISFGNKIGAVILPLPVTIEDDVTRLLKIRDMTSILQLSPEPYVARQLLHLIGLLPQGIVCLFWDLLAYRVTNSISNVPGPSFPVCWSEGGPELERLTFFVPPQGTIASFMTILSYNNQVSMGCLSDSRAIGEPREVLDLFQSEYDKLRLKIEQLQASGELKERLQLSEKHRHHE